MKLAALSAYLDKFLRVADFADDSQNGLQVETGREITTVAFAVDAAQAVFQKAAAEGAQLLVVHHGLFWSGPLCLTGLHYRRIKTLLEAQVGLYACHLPLDAHPQVGNNAELVRSLKLKRVRPFGEYHKMVIGLGGELPRPVPLDDLVQWLSAATGSKPVKVLAHGPRRVRKVACISGGAADMLGQVEAAGFDTYVTGENSHRAFHVAAELGLNVIFGGHYATETVGVKALARHLEKKFRLKTVFLDLPTGA